MGIAAARLCLKISRQLRWRFAHGDEARCLRTHEPVSILIKHVHGAGEKPVYACPNLRILAPETILATLNIAKKPQKRTLLGHNPRKSPIERLGGGPGRTRTSNLTVMSGQL